VTDAINVTDAIKRYIEELDMSVMAEELLLKLYDEDEKFRIIVKAWRDMMQHKRYHITVQKVDRLVRVMGGNVEREKKT